MLQINEDGPALYEEQELTMSEENFNAQLMNELEWQMNENEKD